MHGRSSEEICVIITAGEEYDVVCGADPKCEAIVERVDNFCSSRDTVHTETQCEQMRQEMIDSGALTADGGVGPRFGVWASDELKDYGCCSNTACATFRMYSAPHFVSRALADGRCVDVLADDCTVDLDPRSHSSSALAV